MKTTSSIISLQKENAALKEQIHEIERENKLHKIILENQTELICEFLPDGTLVFVNQAYCDFFNRSKEELTGFNFFAFIPRNYHQYMKRHFSSFTPENPVKRVEHEVMSADGKVYWQEWINKAIFNSDGSISEFQSVGRDITNQKRLQKGLMESQAKLRAVFDSSLVSFIIINKNYELVDFNAIANAYSLLIYHKSLRKNAIIDEYIHPVNLQSFILFMEKTFEGEVVNFEYRCLSPYIWFENSFSPIINPQGKIESICFSSIDITNKRLCDDTRQFNTPRAQVLEDPGNIPPDSPLLV